MNILLVYPRPDIARPLRFNFSYDQLTLATILRNKAKIFLKDYSVQAYTPQSLLSFVSEHKIDLALLECDSFALKHSTNLKHAAQIGSLLQKHMPVIAYGKQMCLQPSLVPWAKMCVRHVGLVGINEVLAAVNQLGGTKFKPVASYDAVPYINRSLLKSIHFYRKHAQCTCIQTALGCVQHCRFCPQHTLYSGFLPHSDTYTLGEFKLLKQQGFRYVWVNDLNFTSDLERAKRILGALYDAHITDNMSLFLNCGSSFDSEFVDLAALCNVRTLNVGIESVVPEILQDYGKQLHIEATLDACQYAWNKGIYTVGNFMLGAPHETVQTIKQMFHKLYAYNFDRLNFNILDYLPGTALYADWKDGRHLESLDLSPIPALTASQAASAAQAPTPPAASVSPAATSQDASSDAHTQRQMPLSSHVPYPYLQCQEQPMPKISMQSQVQKQAQDPAAHPSQSQMQRQSSPQALRFSAPHASYKQSPNLHPAATSTQISSTETQASSTAQLQAAYTSVYPQLSPGNPGSSAAASGAAALAAADIACSSESLPQSSLHSQACLPSLDNNMELPHLPLSAFQRAQSSSLPTNLVHQKDAGSLSQAHAYQVPLTVAQDAALTTNTLAQAAALPNHLAPETELPEQVSPQSDHVFACAETGLNSLKIREMVHMKREFIKSYGELNKTVNKRRVRLLGAAFKMF